MNRVPEGLVADGLAAIRGERLVFSALSFALPPGGALLLEGPNGSGKSTLLRVLAGLGRAEAGALRWNGEDALSDRTTHATRVAYLGHQDAVKPGLTTAENLAFWGTSAQIEAALHRVNLASLAALPARMLSAGQKRRLALARLDAQTGAWEAAVPAIDRVLARDAVERHDDTQFVRLLVETARVALVAERRALAARLLETASFKLARVAEHAAMEDLVDEVNRLLTELGVAPA